MRTYLLSTLFFKSPGEHPHLNYIDGASWQAKCRLHWVHYAVREKKQGEARVHEFYIEDNVEQPCVILAGRPEARHGRRHTVEDQVVLLLPNLPAHRKGIDRRVFALQRRWRGDASQL